MRASLESDGKVTIARLSPSENQDGPMEAAGAGIPIDKGKRKSYRLHSFRETRWK
jgi:hypothetical protein